MHQFQMKTVIMNHLKTIVNFLKAYIEDLRKEFQAFKEITMEKIGQLEIELSTTKLENSELKEKTNLSKLE